MFENAKKKIIRSTCNTLTAVEKKTTISWGQNRKQEQQLMAFLASVELQRKIKTNPIQFTNWSIAIYRVNNIIYYEKKNVFAFCREFQERS